ncbi:MAG: HD domain-containing phosphohydrolase [Pirellulaceae bacterium]
MNETYRSIPVSELSSDVVLSAPVYDAHGRQTKLLGSGVRLTEGRIHKLHQLGVTNVSISLRDVAATNLFKPQGTLKSVPSDHVFPRSFVKNDETEKLDEVIESGNGLTVDPCESSILDAIQDSSPDIYNRSAVQALSAQYESNLVYLDDLYKTFIASGSPDIAGLERICQRAIETLLADKDMFACLGVNPFGVDYPVRHSLHVALLSIAIGVQLGLDDANLMDLGVGCLIHDLGMLRVETRVHEKTQRLNPRELSLVSNHPVHTLHYLGMARASVSARARIVAYQIHERCNGTGYPRRRQGNQIHDLAKIAAVADVYVGLVASRSFRKGLQPYRAVEKILYDMRAGLFSPRVIRGLLETISLFPIGSYVTLNSGQAARVIRANGKSYDRPIVELLSPTGTPSTVVDLDRDRSLSVVKTIPRVTKF